MDGQASCQTSQSLNAAHISCMDVGATSEISVCPSQRAMREVLCIPRATKRRNRVFPKAVAHIHVQTTGNLVISYLSK